MLLHARGDAPRRPCSDHAARVRDAGLAAAGRPGVITYSRKVFIPLTRLCRDRCGYCTFATAPHKLRRALPLAPTRCWRSPGRARRWAARRRCSPSATGRRTGGTQAREWLRRARLRRHAVLRARDGDPGAGGDRAAAAPEPRRADLAGPAAAQAGRAVDGHDAGDDLAAAVRGEGRAALRLARQGPGGPAAGAGGRRAARTCRSRPASSSASARRSRSAPSRSSRSGGWRASTAAIQEVIVQNFRAKPDTAMRGMPDADLDELAATIAVTRLVLGPEGARAGAAEPGRRPSTR